MAKQNSSGIGILGLLGILFVGLKLTNQIDWSWWYVTMPFWAGFALVIGIMGLAWSMVGVITLIEILLKRK